MVAVTVDEVIVEFKAVTDKANRKIAEHDRVVKQRTTSIERNIKKTADVMERNFSRMADAGSKVGKGLSAQATGLQRVNSLYQRGAGQANAYAAAVDRTAAALRRTRGAAAGAVGSLRGVLGAFNPTALAAGFAGGLAFGVIGIAEQAISRLLGAVFKANAEGKTLEQTLGDLEQAAQRYDAAAKAASVSNEDLAKTYGSAATKARELLQAQERLAAIDLQEAQRAAALSLEQGIREALKLEDIRLSPEQILDPAAAEQSARAFAQRLRDSLGDEVSETLTATLGDIEAIEFGQLEANIERLQGVTGLTAEEARKLEAAFVELGQARTAEEQAIAWAKVATEVNKISPALLAVNPELRRMVDEINKAALEAAKTAQNAAQIAPAIAPAIGAANQLAGALANASKQAANVVANQRKALAVAQARVKFFGQEVQLAGELARINAEGVIDTSGFTTRPGADLGSEEAAKSAATAINQQVQETVRLAEETAQAEIQLKKLNDEQDRLTRAASGTGRPSGGGGGGGGGARARGGGGNAFTRLVGDIQAQTEAYRLQTEQLGQSNAVVDEARVGAEALRIEQQLLAAAIREGVTVTPELRSQISQLAQSYAQAKTAAGEFGSSIRQTSQGLGEFGSIASSAIKGFINDLRNGKSASEALLNVLNRVADRVLDIALNAVFSGLGGGGGLSLFGFRGGGDPRRTRGSRVPGYAPGGSVSGPGTGTSDSIPAIGPRGPIRISDGEFIVNAQASRQYRQLLEAINSGQRIRGFQGGGDPSGAAPAVNVGMPGIDIYLVSDEGAALERASRTPRGRNALIAFNDQNQAALNRGG